MQWQNQLMSMQRKNEMTCIAKSNSRSPKEKSSELQAVDEQLDAKLLQLKNSGLSFVTLAGPISLCVDLFAFICVYDP